MLTIDLNSAYAIAPADRKDWNKTVMNQQAYDRLLSSLLSDIRDMSHESREHGERMAELSWQIGKRMGLPQSQLQDLVLLAKVHDLGKTMIADKILNKSGPLDEPEWAEMKMHPIYGFKIARMNPTIHHLSESILFHHEHWNGLGYPHGLSGTAIPLLARIIAVVDAFDAMTHDRPYRLAMRIDEALNELQLESGLQFDPAIVEIVINMMRKSF